MKNLKLVFIMASVLMLFSGSAWVNLTLVRPSEIMLPDDIRTIAIIDRSQRAETPVSKLEEVVTGEFFKQDEQAVFRLAEGFINACSSIDRYVTIKTSEKYTGDGTKNELPSLLDWNEVKDICSRYEADAVMSIETFDSDFILTNLPVNTETRNELGQLISQLHYRASGVAVIRLGIRIYDSKSMTILDEYQTTYKMNFEGQGINLQDAVNQIIDKTEAVKRAGYEAGFIYGGRITPTYYQVTRYFYNKPKKALGAGVRRSEVADWTGAIESWSRVVETGKRKHAGRAALNIAVGYEVLGDLEKAKEWASRSYVDFEEKEAENYYDVLVDRIRMEDVVEEQLSEEN